MSANILVATPQTAVGELLRFSLEDSSRRYRVRLAQSGHEALAAAGRIKFDLVILDAALPDQPLAALAAALLESNPQMRLVIIPPENDASEVALNSGAPDAILNLPFYAPDLFETMDRLLAAPAENASPDSPPPSIPAVHHLFGDPIQAAELVDSLLKQGSGRQALVVRDRQLWTSSGQLEKKHQQELVEVLNRSWDSLAPCDVARFVRLTDGGGEVMLYATSLAIDSVLAVIFDSNAPLTRIRGQANKLAQALRAYFAQIETAEVPAAQAAEIQSAGNEPAPEPAPLPAFESLPPAPVQEAAEEFSDLFSTSAPTDQAAIDLLQALEKESGKSPPILTETPVATEIQPPSEKPASEPVNPETVEAVEETENESEMPEISLSDLLAAMPSPDPKERSLSPGIEWVTEAEEAEPGREDFLFPWERAAAQEPAVPLEIEDTQPIHSRASGILPVPPAEEQAREPVLSTPEPEPVDGSTDKIRTGAANTQPAGQEGAQGELPGSSLPDAGEDLPPGLDAVQIRNKLEDIEASAAEFACLTYTCIMIPALPEMKLSGPLAERLAEWLPQLCLAYGWRLVSQDIRPETFQWTVQVSQVVSPGNIVRLVRLQTSQRILDEFGKNASFSPSGQFWAPGYLIISGSTPPETSLVQNFLEQSRKRMGAPR